MADFYQLNSIHHNDVVMINLDNVGKVEECDTFVRLYLNSGDVEEVDLKSFASAIKESCTQYMHLMMNEKEEFDNLDDGDIEDVTDLSDGLLVADSDLAEPVENAVVEGGDVSETPTMKKEDFEKLIDLIRSGKIQLS